MAEASPLAQLRTDLGEPFDLAAILSVLVLVPSPDRFGLATTAVLALLAAATVAVRAVRRSPWAWVAFALAHAVTFVPGWYRYDNHDALILYWCLALAIAAATREERASALAVQARWMTGIVFVLATGWKVLSGQFVSGDFFRYALLVDRRFDLATRQVAGVPPEAVVANGQALGAAATSAVPGRAVLAGADEVALLVLLLTAGTVLVEAAVAATMLWPDRGRRVAAVRAVTLAVFLVATYAIVPVSRFGVLLAAMAIPHAPPGRRWRTGFAVGGVLLVAWGEVWSAATGIG